MNGIFKPKLDKNLMYELEYLNKKNNDPRESVYIHNYKDVNISKNNQPKQVDIMNNNRLFNKENLNSLLIKKELDEKNYKANKFNSLLNLPVMKTTFEKEKQLKFISNKISDLRQIEQREEKINRNIGTNIINEQQLFLKNYNIKDININKEVEMKTIDNMISYFFKNRQIQPNYKSFKNLVNSINKIQMFNTMINKDSYDKIKVNKVVDNVIKNSSFTLSMLNKNILKENLNKILETKNINLNINLRNNNFIYDNIDKNNYNKQNGNLITNLKNNYTNNTQVDQTLILCHNNIKLFNSLKNSGVYNQNIEKQLDNKEINLYLYLHEKYIDKTKINKNIKNIIFQQRQNLINNIQFETPNVLKDNYRKNINIKENKLYLRDNYYKNKEIQKDNYLKNIEIKENKVKSQNLNPVNTEFLKNKKFDVNMKPIEDRNIIIPNINKVRYLEDIR